jgi:hypothetical protein
MEKEKEGKTSFYKTFIIAGQRRQRRVKKI